MRRNHIPGDFELRHTGSYEHWPQVASINRRLVEQAYTIINAPIKPRRAWRTSEKASKSNEANGGGAQWQKNSLGDTTLACSWWSKWTYFDLSELLLCHAAEIRIQLAWSQSQLWLLHGMRQRKERRSVRSGGRSRRLQREQDALSPIISQYTAVQEHQLWHPSKKSRASMYSSVLNDLMYGWGMRWCSRSLIQMLEKCQSLPLMDNKMMTDMLKAKNWESPAHSTKSWSDSRQCNNAHSTYGHS